MDLKKEGQSGDVIFTVENLHVKDERGLPAVKDVSFQVREQEVVGIAGVSGNGQSELALALAGLLDCEYESMTLNQKSITKQDLSN